MAKVCNPLHLLVGILISTIILSTTDAFALGFAPSPRTQSKTSFTQLSLSTTATTSSSSSNTNKNVIVISPPGGLGEITSINSARLGGHVKWFVVSAPTTAAANNSQQKQQTSQQKQQQIALTSETLNAISNSGGSLDFAGASADTLLCNSGGGVDSSSSSALSAMSSWLLTKKEGDTTNTAPSSTTSIICTYDGALEEKKRVNSYKSQEEIESSLNNEDTLIKNGIKLAARMAVNTLSSNNNGGRSSEKIALLSATEKEVGMMSVNNDSKREENNGGVGRFIGELFGGEKDDTVDIPSSLNDALGGGLTTVVRYGELFGAPESSPESSPFMGGPRRDPTVRDMYTLRSARIDPTVSISGNVGGGDTRSNRLAVGELASQLGLGMIHTATSTSKMPLLDVSLSSFAGTESPTNEEWNAEFERVLANMKSTTNIGSGTQLLFSADFSSVPSTKRLADWIATKWAPTILRSYDIAGTRVGARPVYAIQTGDDETTIEIVWQELVDFKSVTSGKMIINVAEIGITALRGPGNVSDGFGTVSSTPLPGEDILVRRLADAASQAVEKGLAAKPQLTKKAKATAAAVKEPVSAVVAQPTATSSSPSSDGTGPRSAGARRSAERSRGKRKSPLSGGDGN